MAKSTHAGLPWLRFIRQRLGDQVHFWPFDGWDIPAGRSAIAEIYPALWNQNYPREDRTPTSMTLSPSPLRYRAPTPMAVSPDFCIPIYPRPEGAVA